MCSSAAAVRIVPLAGRASQKLGQRELEERQPALGLGRGRGQAVDQRVRLEGHALDARRADDGVADVGGRHRLQEVERARDLVHQSGQARQEVAARGDQEPQIRGARREAAQRPAHQRGLLGLGHGDELLQLIDEQQEPATFAQVPAHEVIEHGRLGPHGRRDHAWLLPEVTEYRGQRLGQRGHGPGAGDGAHDVPAP